MKDAHSHVKIVFLEPQLLAKIVSLAMSMNKDLIPVTLILHAILILLVRDVQGIIICRLEDVKHVHQ